MAHSYSKNYQHIILGVKYREAILDPKHNIELQKYITGLIKKRNSYLIAINNVEDHMHIFLDLHRAYSVAKMVQEIKSLSSLFINRKKWYLHHFNWQGGYGAFSISNTHRWNVITYIKNQQKHHGTKTFKEEYIEILEKNNVPINDETLFEDLI